MFRIRLLAGFLSTGLLLLQAPAAFGTAASTDYEFVSPLPGSTLVLPETNIILRPGGTVDVASVSPSLIHASGSISGSHEGRLTLSDDHGTLTFQPDVPFVPSEIVTWRIDPGLVTDTRGEIPPSALTFTVSGPDREALRDFPIPTEADEIASEGQAPANSVLRSGALVGPLPEDFPHIQTTVNGTTAPGRLFLADLRFMISGPRPSSYLMILENDGTPLFYRKLASVGLDFKVLPDGRLTYFDVAAGAYFALNANYAVVDSFRCGNGYTTDSHDIVLLPNGHVVLMSYDPQVVDLTAVGGQPNAIVIGLILQELDQARNVVFQWRSWDHFQITDIIFHSLTTAVVDYVHGNSVDVDPDGNFILSSRHMNEVTKISRTTGGILWRLGGRNNQFTFVNDPVPFSHQHDARRLPNGHITLFDNGNFKVPRFSRAVEYAIDEAQKTATVVWQYRLTPDVFGGAFGTVQRLANGNTLIGWGATAPAITEVAPDGSIVSTLTLDPGVASYRAFRFEWPPVKPAKVTLNPTSLVEGTTSNWVAAKVQPVDRNFTVSDIELSTLRLAGIVPADTMNVKWIDPTLNGGVAALVVRFARAALAPLLTLGTNLLEVSGSLKTGEIVRGSATLSLVSPRMNTIRLVSAPGLLPVELSIGGTVAPNRTISVYDVQGRLVNHWRAGARTTWDGRSSDGRRVGSGIYLIRGDDQGRGSALKIAIVR
jgi:arylsulfotransferase ASST